MNAEHVRNDFPILNKKKQGQRFVYLDSAASSQKPMSVIESMSNYYKETHSNVHRGLYDASVEATRLYEESRKKLARFANSQPEEMIFTRNATESLNLVARSLGDQLITKDDCVLTTYLEHHSNLVPWQLLVQRKKARLVAARITREGTLDMADFEKKLDEQPKLVAITLCSNVTGTLPDIKKMVMKAHQQGAVVVVDGAQGVPHMEVDVKSMGMDFMAITGHKMLGPTGIGALYGKKEWLENMPPFLGGGDMIKEVKIQQSTWNDLPFKFEAGTPNISGAIGLGTAIDYLNDLGMHQVRDHEKKLFKHAYGALSERGMTVYGPSDADEKSGIIAFNIEGLHSHDIASILNERNIAIRAGHHCAQPLVNALGAVAMARASFYVYNTEDDIDQMVLALSHAQRILGKSK
ncbi:SufS family cysteine desulfurase [Candidatus Micrarchaeota archaeon]|nr:SufS family cysteine desulfurase [Candidatus Micrarchaeota archaeon]